MIKRLQKMATRVAVDAMHGVRIRDRVGIFAYYALTLLNRVILRRRGWPSFGKRRFLFDLHGVHFFVRTNFPDMMHLSYAFEPEVTELIIHLPKRYSGTFIDVGAHVGRYSLLAAKALGSRGRVLAFEPNPVTFKALLDNIRLNGFSNVLAFPYALADRDGEATLYEDPINDGGTNLLEERGGRKWRVPLRRLDTLIPADEHVFMIKVDVEGAEPRVLQGAQSTIARNRPIIIFEALSPRALNDVQKVLDEFSYRYVRLDERNYVALPPNVDLSHLPRDLRSK